MAGRRTTTASRDQGFTLVELLVVIVVLGILAAVAVPVYLGQQRSARDASVVSDVHSTTTTVTHWVLDNGRPAWGRWRPDGDEGRRAWVPDDTGLTCTPVVFFDAEQR